MVSKLLIGRDLGLHVSCKSFPTVYWQPHRSADHGKMTDNYYMHSPTYIVKTCYVSNLASLGVPR